MRLVCLECSAVYEAPDTLFGPQPRDVRCNRCGYQWTVIGSRPDDSMPPAALSVGPAETTAPLAPAVTAPETPSAPAEPMPPFLPKTPILPKTPVLPKPADARPLGGQSRLADSLAGPLPDTELQPPAPIPKAEPAAASTRTLLASDPAAAPAIATPDPEERRLSHELDFGESERRRRPEDAKGGTRRVALLLIAVIAVIIIAAIMFKPQIVALVPQTRAAYAAVGL
jgi:predicted Zn finger-like uncharacterized protein